MSITFSSISIGYDNDPDVISAIDLEIKSGEITILIGPNGCGKSSLLKTVARLLKPRQGKITVDGIDVLNHAPKRIAKKIAFLTQNPLVPTQISVQQLVGYGRAPYQSMLGFRSATDVEQTEKAMHIAGIAHLRHKQVSDLSGGQTQSVFLAMILAQDTPYIILDEPTNHLDITHQIAALELIKRLNGECGKTAILVLHDLNLAARYANRLILLHKGAVVADGTPDHVLTRESIKQVFDVESRIIRDPIFSKPLCIPYPIINQTEPQI